MDSALREHGLETAYPPLDLLIAGERRSGANRAQQNVVNPATKQVLTGGEKDHGAQIVTGGVFTQKLQKLVRRRI